MAVMKTIVTGLEELAHEMFDEIPTLEDDPVAFWRAVEEFAGGQAAAWEGRLNAEALVDRARRSEEYRRETEELLAEMAPTRRPPAPTETGPC